MSTRKSVCILHGSSAANKGDGLLIDEAIKVAQAILGDDVAITVVANHPTTFSYLDATIVDAHPRKFRFSPRYIEVLRNLDEFDLVLGVGGGYLRFGTFKEAAGAAVVHLPQLFAASYTKAPTVYLPQSIGPLDHVFRPVIRSRLKRLDRVWLRDDRSIREISLPNTRRTTDLALYGIAPSRGQKISFDAEALPVLSVRAVDGVIPAPVKRLAELMYPFAGYVQSVTGRNDDSCANDELSPVTSLTRNELMDSPRSRRLVVAVRMHAALMALAAGHYVIHLAYERKGFSAFEDLGLSEYVHNVRSFDADYVYSQLVRLRERPEARVHFDLRIGDTWSKRSQGRTHILEDTQMILSTDIKESGETWSTS